MVPVGYDLKRDSEAKRFERCWVEQIRRDYYRTYQHPYIYT